MQRFGGFLLSLAILMVLVGGVFAAPTPQSNLFEVFLLSARADLESLARFVFADELPDSWTYTISKSPNQPTFASDLWFDLEQLADEVYEGERPEDWLGITSTNSELIARNVRHDLELVADAIFAEAEEIDRPEGWNGAAPIYRCERAVQNISRLLIQFHLVRSSVPESTLNYCQAVATEVEDELINIVLSETDLDTRVPDLALGIRGDLERLADEMLGLNTRPAQWRGNVDANSERLIDDIFLDLELLATELLDIERPLGWIGVPTNLPSLAVRNLRLNLELLADDVLAERELEGGRPRGWQGLEPIASCLPVVQNLVTIVGLNYDFDVEALAEETEPDVFCDEVALAANHLAENPPIDEVIEAAEDVRFTFESEFAFTYLDLAALEYMGIMPLGTEFRAWYRNFNESNMMFVSGLDFALFLDRRWTTMPVAVFESLPTLDGVKPLTFCDAFWCNGPGPTPTPTGQGPLEALVDASTPPPTLDLSGGSVGGKTQVSWNHIRVAYLLDKADTGTAQVTLEICREAAQIACEPVLRVFDGNTGTNKPVVSQFNGQNVYEFPYGYTSNLQIEGNTLISPDVWISDPTIR